MGKDQNYQNKFKCFSDSYMRIGGEGDYPLLRVQKKVTGLRLLED